MSKQTKHAKTKSKTKDKSMDIDNIRIRGEYIENALNDFFDDENE